MSNMLAGVKRVKEKYLTNEPNKLECVCAFIALFLIFVNMYYQDNAVIFLKYFWANETVFNGGVSYIFTADMAYGIIQDIIGRIWVLPVNIVNAIVHIEPGSVICTLWYKVCILLFVFWAMHELLGLLDLLSIKDKKWFILLLSTSVLFALPVFHVAQTDMIYICFMIKAYRAYIEDDRRSFLLWSALAVDIKYFILFFFVPIILIKEKRILCIIRDVILICIILPVQIVWGRLAVFVDSKVNQCSVVMQKLVVSASDGAGAISTSGTYGFISHFWNKMLYFELPAIRKGQVASVLVLVFALVCIWCFTRNDKEHLIDNSLFAGTVSLGAFYVLSSPSPYWVVALFPLVFIIAFRYQSIIRINLILTQVFSFTLLLVYMQDQPHVFGGSVSFNWLPLTEWFHIVPSGHSFEYGPQVADYLQKYGVFNYMPIYVSLCLACAIAFVAINYPREKRPVDSALSVEDIKKLYHVHATFQIAFLLLWFVINLFCVSRY